MGREGVDVPEACISDTRRRAPVVHQLQDVVTAFPHALEPRPRNRPQVLRLPVEPGLNARAALHRSGETEDGAHCQWSRLSSRGHEEDYSQTSRRATSGYFQWSAFSRVMEPLSSNATT